MGQWGKQCQQWLRWLMMDLDVEPQRWQSLNAGASLQRELLVWISWLDSRCYYSASNEKAAEGKIFARRRWQPEWMACKMPQAAGWCVGGASVSFSWCPFLAGAVLGVGWGRGDENAHNSSSRSADTDYLHWNAVFRGLGWWYYSPELLGIVVQGRDLWRCWEKGRLQKPKLGCIWKAEQGGDLLLNKQRLLHNSCKVTQLTSDEGNSKLQLFFI